jgi:D-serine dehydratase
MTETTNHNSLSIPDYLLDVTVKGIPGGTKPFPLSQIAEHKWNVLRQDLPFPLLVLKQSALLHNMQLMNQFLQEHQVSIAPHGKTHMSPQLAEMQLSAGAWGITAATVSQVQVFRKFGVPRIILANQLVGRQHIRYIVEELNADKNFDFYCLVDSVQGVRNLAHWSQHCGLQRRLKVLLEGGFSGGRTGCRTLEQARNVISELRNVRDRLTLAGIEGFEGVIAADNPDSTAERVRDYLEFLKQVLAELQPQDFHGVDEVILSAGGSAYFDLVARSFHEVKFSLPKRVVLRSGCYITHDSRMYRDYHEQMLTRGWHGAQFKAAFEIWSYVQSIPEKGLAILTMGKRDCSYDYYLPTPLSRHRGKETVLDLSRCQITKLNDQHAYMTFPDNEDLSFGDLIACGISHPCTAFDKWKFIPLVNDNYDVVDGVMTYF